MPSDLPDARDGLSRLQRVCLVALAKLHRERPGRPISMLQLYGRVVEHFDCSEDEMRVAVSGLKTAMDRLSESGV